MHQVIARFLAIIASDVKGGKGLGSIAVGKSVPGAARA
jgi:hypothetical protein